MNLAFITDDDDAKMLKMQHIFAYNGLPWGGQPTRDLHLWKAVVELMLSSDMQRCNLYRFRDIRGQNSGPKFRILGAQGQRPQKGRRPIRDRYMPSCKISGRSVPPAPRYLKPDIEKQRT